MKVDFINVKSSQYAEAMWKCFEDICKRKDYPQHTTFGKRSCCVYVLKDKTRIYVWQVKPNHWKLEPTHD